MPKKYEVQNLILQALENRDLSRIELLHSIRKESGLSISDKTLNESLIYLLRQHKVGVVGYDLKIYDGLSRVQSMKADGIIFTRFKNDSFEIGILISKLESEDIENVRNAINRLKIIFKNKISYLEDINLDGDSDATFNKIMHYINIQDDNQKRVMTQKFALALSDEKDSTETLRQLIAIFGIK
ncbi:MAG: hypothetical protein Q8M97_04600 [Methanobacteriaceae archaeon]|nr:hypothetical protein [Methanobacteriaceae archaeon]